jgi:N-acetylglucosamine kinase-like BadF-type ATPase
MIVIADSGSTKTDWCLLSATGGVKTAQTDGLNPYLIDENGILNILEKDLYPFLDNKKVEQVFFYGSGCMLPYKKQVLKNALDSFFTRADIEVYSDLLGAARAVCGTTSGLVCILGTGSSSCLYDGTQITEYLPSLGFLLGDEGSGAYLGKQFMAAYLSN